MRRRSAARAQAWRAGWVSTCALTQQERHQRKGTTVENSYKDLFAIATLGDARDTRKREGVIDALADPDDPASSLEEAKDRAGLGHQEIERIEQDRACSMNSDWASAGPQFLGRFVRLVASWDHKLASALLGAARVSIKSWEEP